MAWLAISMMSSQQGQGHTCNNTSQEHKSPWERATNIDSAEGAMLNATYQVCEEKLKMSESSGTSVSYESLERLSIEQALRLLYQLYFHYYLPVCFKNGHFRLERALLDLPPCAQSC